jgi:23S rRNA (cytidine1920-2'-O)/16S rRNA (cytidine1409-2'-O)-methyltransferase
MAGFASRAGLKLEHALTTFSIDVRGSVCADLGSNVGGFVDCLLKRGASRVYAMEKGYGVLEWRLRRDPRVVVMERTNAMHANLSERVDLVTIDVAWTKQRHILPPARRMVKDTGLVVTLIKPHYEADQELLAGGVLPQERVEEVVRSVTEGISRLGFEMIGTVRSPIQGAKGNVEVLAALRPAGIDKPAPESAV